jgi:hypothetical protein
VVLAQQEDDYVEVELDMDKEILFDLFFMAHQKNITANEMCNIILKDYLNSLYVDEKNIILDGEDL